MIFHQLRVINPSCCDCYDILNFVAKNSLYVCLLEHILQQQILHAFEVYELLIECIV